MTMRRLAYAAGFILGVPLFGAVVVMDVLDARKRAKLPSTLDR